MSSDAHTRKQYGTHKHTNLCQHTLYVVPSPLHARLRRPPKSEFSGYTEGQHRRDLGRVLKLHHHSATGLHHRGESSTSLKIAKMKSAFLKQHPMQPYIYLTLDNHSKLRLIHSSPLIFLRAQKVCKARSYISSTVQARRVGGQRCPMTCSRSNSYYKVGSELKLRSPSF